MDDWLIQKMTADDWASWAWQQSPEAWQQISSPYETWTLAFSGLISKLTTIFLMSSVIVYSCG